MGFHGIYCSGDNMTSNHSPKTYNQLKICILVYSKFPSIGGYENLVYYLSQSLSKNLDTHVVCRELNSSILIPNNIKLHLLKPILEKVHFAGSINMIYNLISFYILCRKEEFDIIHAHLCFPSGLISLSAKLLGIPIICTSHGADIQINNSMRYGLRRNLIISALIKLTLRSIDMHTIVSKSMMQDAIASGSPSDRIRVVYNGIPLKDIVVIDDNVLSEIGIKIDDFIILYLGRLHIKKRPEDLLKAFIIASRIVMNSKLIFAGDGNEEQKLRNLVADEGLTERVVFMGFVSNAEKNCLLKRCNVFVLPSEVEAFGITLIEAMSYEKPVIATDVGPFPEIITNNKNGILVHARSPNDLADEIIKLFYNKRLREELGKAARKEVEARFSIDIISKNYIDIYQELCTRSSDIDHI